MLVASACTTGAERAGPTEGGTKAVATPTNRASTSFVMIWPRRKLKAGLGVGGGPAKVGSDETTIYSRSSIVFGSMRAVVLALLAGVAAGFVPAAPAAARVARTVVKGAEVRNRARFPR